MAILMSIALASFVQGSVGFGYGIIATGLLAIFIDVRAASVVMVLGGLAQNVTIFASLRQHFSWRNVTGLIVSAAVGVPFGVSFLVLTDAKWVLFTLGCLLITSVLRPKATKVGSRPLPPLLGLPAGFLSGLLHGALGAGAPLAVLYARRQAIPRLRYVATLQVLLGVSTLVRAIFLGNSGLFSRDLTAISIVSVLFAMVGARIGVSVSGVVSSKALERATNVLLLILGVRYVLSIF